MKVDIDEILITRDYAEESVNILLRAHAVAQRLVGEPLEDVVTPVDDLDDATVVSFGFGLLLGKLLERRQGPGPHRCGWCDVAAGPTVEAWNALPDMNDEDIQAHTLTCEHNPLVARANAAEFERDLWKQRAESALADLANMTPAAPAIPE